MASAHKILLTFGEILTNLLYHQTEKKLEKHLGKLPLPHGEK